MPSEDKSFNREKSQGNKSRDKNPNRSVGFGAAHLRNKDHVKTKENETTEDINERNSVQYQITDNLNISKDIEEDLEKVITKEKEKFQSKASKSFRSPYKGLGTLYGHNKQNHADKLIAQASSSLEYNSVGVSPNLEIEGLELKTRKDIEDEEDLPRGWDDKAKIEELLKRIDVEELHRDLHLALIYKTNHNSVSFTKKVAAVLGCLGQCELFTDRQNQTACRILTLIAQSEAKAFLTQQFAVDALVRVLNSQNTSYKLKSQIVDIFYMLAKSPGLRIRLLDTSLVSDITKICISIINNKNMLPEASGFLLITLYCLLTLGKVFNRRGYHPEIFNEMQPARVSFLCQGGLFALWVLINKLTEKEIKTFAYKNFFDYVIVEDLEQQLILIKGLSQRFNLFKNKTKTQPDLGVIEEVVQLKKTTTLSHANFYNLEQKKEGLDNNLGNKNAMVLPSLSNQNKKPSRIEADKSEGRTTPQVPESPEKSVENKTGMEETPTFFQDIADIFVKEKLTEEFEEYIELRKEGRFGFENEDRERRKLLLMADNAKKEEGRTGEVENSFGGKKISIDHFEKKYQLEVNCVQKEIKDLLKEKDNEERRKPSKSVLLQKAETMKKRNKLEIKKKELQKLASNEKAEQIRAPQFGPLEINLKKGNNPNKEISKEKPEDEQSLLKYLSTGLMNELKANAKKVTGPLEILSYPLKSVDKAYIQSEAHTYALAPPGLKQKLDEMLDMNSRRNSEQKADESHLPLIHPWKSAKGALNDFLKSPEKHQLVLKSKKLRSNFTEVRGSIPRNYVFETLGSQPIDETEEKLSIPDISQTKIKLFRGNPGDLSLPPVQNPAKTVGFYDESHIISGLKSFSMLMDNKRHNHFKSKKRNSVVNLTGKSITGKDPARVINPNETSPLIKKL